MPITVIPAAPDWFACEPVHDESDCIDGLDEVPVIAWAVTCDVRDGDVVATYAHPVAADCVLADRWDSPVVLRRPDGRYVVSDDRDFRTTGEVLSYLRQRAGVKRRRSTTS